MGSSTFQLSRLFWVVPNLSSLASCHPAADGHSGPAPRCGSTRWPSTWGFVCPAGRYLQLHLSAETQWKQGRADVFKLDMSRVEILSPTLSSATWFVLGHHWNSQSRSEAQPHGSWGGVQATAASSDPCKCGLLLSTGLQQKQNLQSSCFSRESK